MLENQKWSISIVEEVNFAKMYGKSFQETMSSVGKLEYPSQVIYTNQKGKKRKAGW